MSGHGNHAAAAWHLQRWLEAYGPDLVLPAGTAIERPAEPKPATASANTLPADMLPADIQPADMQPADAQSVGAQSAGAPPADVPAPAAPPPAYGQPQLAEKKELPETKALRELRREVLPCTSCKLHENRQYTVFGEGNHQARVLFVGEAPGTREDQTGRPFVGPAGQLLDKILEGAMGLSREDVYIANINKCHPPGNRDPEPDEVAACLPYLKRQVEILQPEVIVCLGRVAGQNLLGSTESTSALRRRQHDYHGIPVIVTWHPAYLLRQPARKRDTWEDIKRVNKLLGMPDTPGRK